MWRRAREAMGRGGCADGWICAGWKGLGLKREG